MVEGCLTWPSINSPLVDMCDRVAELSFMYITDIAIFQIGLYDVGGVGPETGLPLAGRVWFV